MIRCYNCGEVGHRTQHCVEYGPYYVEPGKTSQDYSELSQRIADMFAQDIITEHLAGHNGGETEDRIQDAGRAAVAGSEGAGGHADAAHEGM